MEFKERTFTPFECRTMKDPRTDIPWELSRIGMDLRRIHFRSDLPEVGICFWQAMGPYHPPRGVESGKAVPAMLSAKMRWRLQCSLQRYRLLTGFLPMQAIRQAGMWLEDRKVLAPIRNETDQDQRRKSCGARTSRSTVASTKNLAQQRELSSLPLHRLVHRF